MGAERSLRGAEAVFLALLTIGLMGLLFLIIYGNLSNNLGFGKDSLAFANNNVTLTDTYQNVTDLTSRINPVLSSLVVYNSTNSSNTLSFGTGYLVSGGQMKINTTGVFNATDGVNISGTLSYDSTGRVNTENVITNLTSGATEFFTFSSVWFILTAITILIGIVLGVIALVRKTGGAGLAGKSKGRSEFVG